MIEAQRHRGPDGDGFWSGASIALGHCRLKILDLTEAGRQPMVTSDGRYVIVFNGEVYNFRELRRQLTDDFPFVSHTDTEVVLYAFAKWGTRCLDRLVGMFALAIWDTRARALFCARDRLGIKPFYYTVSDGIFRFSSEIRGLLAAGVAAEVNPPVLYDFLARDYYEHSDETFFKGIYKLPPAHFAVWEDSSLGTPQAYWSLADATSEIGLEQAPIAREEQLLELATTAVGSHLVSDVPVGIALSGGLDSATLLALLGATHPNPSQVEAFSFCTPDVAYSERPFVEAMAAHTGHRAHFVEMNAAAFSGTVELVSDQQEEPFAGAPISAYSLCFERAREQGFIVLMDGSGVDEGLAGYGRFLPALWADLFSAGAWRDLEGELESVGLVTAEQRAGALQRAAVAARSQSDEGVSQDLTVSVRADCLATDFVNESRRELAPFERPFPDCLRNLMYRELRYTKLPRALRFRDRLSMAVGTELRPPFLDHRLLSFEFALPRQDLIHRGVSKAILRRAAERLLPDAVRLASKRSVQTPQREWFRGELQDWVRQRIDTPSFWDRGWVDRRRALRAMDGFFKGHGDNSFFLWQWINLEIWAQRFLDG